MACALKWPNTRSAPGFQNVMSPFASAATIASDAVDKIACASSSTRGSGLSPPGCQDIASAFVSSSALRDRFPQLLRKQGKRVSLPSATRRVFDAEASATHRPGREAGFEDREDRVH